MSVRLARSAASHFAPVNRTYTSGTSATETAPLGATNVIIEAWGGGGGGEDGWFSDAAEFGGDGKAGGYCRSSYPIVGGQTLVYTVGSGGARGGPATNGTATTVVSGTKTITSMNAGGGGGGGIANQGAPGAAPSATGGNVVNLVSTSYVPITGSYGDTGGNGGQGKLYPQPGIAGTVGKVIFHYT